MSAFESARATWSARRDRLRAWLRGDGVVASREAACRAAGIEDPAMALHVLDLVAVGRAVYEGRYPAPIGRSPALSCQLATNALELVVARFPPVALDPKLAEAASRPAWTLTNREANRTTRAVYQEIDRRLAPRRRVLLRLSRAGAVARWRAATVASVAGVLVAGLTAALVVLTRPRDLLADRSYRLSSAAKDFDAANHTWRGQRQSIFFMTNDEPSPWIEYDLGKPTTLRRVVAENRPDCCRERAIPLVIEASDDATTWREVTRITHEFYSWDARFPAETMRYLRLRTDKKNILHMSSIAAYDR